jgi:hypothetical protein
MVVRALLEIDDALLPRGFEAGNSLITTTGLTVLYARLQLCALHQVRSGTQSADVIF